MSRPRATSSNSSAMLSIDVPTPLDPIMGPRTACWSSRELSAGRGRAGVVPKLFCWWHCGSRRRRSAPYAVLIEPTC
jgi:hypothetical protein